MKVAVALTLAAGVLSAPAPLHIGGSAGVGGHAGVSVGGSAGVGSAVGGGVGFVRRDGEAADLEARDPLRIGGSVGGHAGASVGAHAGIGSGIGLGIRDVDESDDSANLEARQFGGLGGSSTSNDVTDNNGCKELTFIFARGTTEIGNMGTVVGPKVASELQSLTGNKAAIQGVDYPADAAGNAQMGGSGGPKMAELVETAKKQCPDTKIVLGGYSQGAMVVHNAAGKLSSGQVVGAVTFGDPFKTQKPANIEQFKTYCASGDPVCLSGGNVMAHLSYGSDAAEAAQFLVNAAGL
ncbi:carbohydrate esterase family 5 protein [Aspergillus undulatus]|uniref:carbohydrate esterase family 5 protein n=1 Tax=Aspergillus undulatus TaxID=1810928 RepID=UPI003CCCE9FB